MRKTFKYGALMVGVAALSLALPSAAFAAPPNGVSPDNSSQMAQCATSMGGQNMADHAKMMGGQGMGDHASMMGQNDPSASGESTPGCSQMNASSAGDSI